jgi:hypothetical protein
MSNDHAVSALVFNIRRSIGALRLACEDLRAEPTKIGLTLVLQLSEELSGHVSGLSRVCDLTTLDSPADAEPKADRKLLDFAEWMIASIDGETCPDCGGAIRPPEPPYEISGSELAQIHIAKQKAEHAHATTRFTTRKN